jgi:hypothetical protein
MAMKIEHPYGNKGETYKFPSYFGSHASMIDQPLTDAVKQLQSGEAPDVPKEQMALLNKLASLMKDDCVVIKDEHKEPYVTSRKALDNGLADPNRYATCRVEYLCNQKKD